MNRKLLNSVLESLDLKLNEEFKIKSYSNSKLKFTNYGLKEYDRNYGWGNCPIQFDDLLKYKIEKTPYKERIREGDLYYFLNPTKITGYSEYKYVNDYTDKIVFKRVEIFETKEEVIKKIKELDWEVQGVII